MRELTHEISKNVTDMSYRNPCKVTPIERQPYWLQGFANTGRSPGVQIALQVSLKDISVTFSEISLKPQNLPRNDKT
jgi:hypothetical protein